jgi:hypothetical protein
MGFSAITLGGSDAASDLAWIVNKWIKGDEGNTAKMAPKPMNEIIVLLDKELSKDYGPYNTPGIINVALVLTDGNAASYLKEDSNFKLLVEKIVFGLDKMIKEFAPDDKHLNRCLEIKVNVEKLS